MQPEPLATTSVITLSHSICKRLAGNKPLISIMFSLPLPLPPHKPLDYGSHALKPESWGALWKTECSIELTGEESGECEGKNPDCGGPGGPWLFTGSCGWLCALPVGWAGGGEVIAWMWLSFCVGSSALSSSEQ